MYLCGVENTNHIGGSSTMADARSEAGSIAFNFTYYAMKLLGKNLYSNPWTAISELVANGIDAKAPTVHVLVDMRDKAHAVVEIFDSGSGMSFDDLKNKYTIIGRDKRKSEDNIEGKTLGRKGIGKLAALYLSPDYYLFTKNGTEESAWRVSTLEYSDDDFPEMNRVEYNPSMLIAAEEWDKQASGTMIHLSNVDLRKIGTERLKRLPISMADYYLDTAIDCKIRVCVLEDATSKIEFTDVKKNISFGTMYAMFDNTEYGYKGLLSPAVYVTKDDVRKEVDYPRTTKLIDPTKYDCDGTIPIRDIKGQLRDCPYKLSGWIGIHCSLDNKVLTRNDPEGKKLRSNALRLYVRGKLAVANLTDYLKMNQAMDNYVEGEISFDILDDDLFEDAATSSREGYSLSDPRVERLIEICRKIVRALINERTAIGTQITSEIRALEAKDKAEAQEKAQREEAARREAEKEAEKAREAQQAAEADAAAAKKEANQYKDQNKVIFSTVSEDQESFATKCHLIKTNAVTIRNSVKTLSKKVDISRYRELGAIALSSERILSSLKYSALANFNLRDEFIEEDLFLFCSQFIDSILAKQYHEIEFSVERSGEAVHTFSPQNMALVLDNLASNSQKSNSTKIWLKFEKVGEKTKISYKDNGTGFAKDDDLIRIFEFGWSGTGGTGIGLYNVHRVINRMQGSIEARRNSPQGALFEIEI